MASTTLYYCDGGANGTYLSRNRHCKPSGTGPVKELCCKFSDRNAYKPAIELGTVPDSALLLKSMTSMGLPVSRGHSDSRRLVQGHKRAKPYATWFQITA